MDQLLILALDVLLILGALWLARQALSMRSTAPFVRTGEKMEEAILEIFRDIPEGDEFYELGAGDGHVLFRVAARNPGIKCVGVERDFVPAALFRAREFFSQFPNVSILQQDFMKTDLSQATHLYAYLFPHVLDALHPKLEKELPQGALLVSLDFKMSAKEPEFVKVEGGRTLYGYRF